ncbi:MAG: radical SAM protein [Candidatus Woesearchaeota archaeon]
MKRDRRLELLVGYTCNNNCMFCYVAAEREKFKDKTTSELKKDMLAARKRGTTELAFLGGEPTIRPDLLELVRFAVDNGFEHIKVTTNGRMMSYPAFVDSIVLAGITKVLFSFHSSKGEIHDKLTRVEGSFRQLMQAVSNVKRHPQVAIETNSTITKHNHTGLPDMARLFISLGMLSSEFIFVFPFGNSLKNFHDIVPSYKESARFMVEALEIGATSKTKVLMRYVPFCILPNHIGYIAELYDPPEREQVGPGFETLDVIKMRKTVDRAQLDKCNACKFTLVCEGPWKIYPRFMGSDEFNPIDGQKVIDVGELRQW